LRGLYHRPRAPTDVSDLRKIEVAQVVKPGDIMMIPQDVGWTKITDVDYLSVSPDPDRVLPAGYVNPPIKK
jgi:hypothetical protein